MASGEDAEKGRVKNFSVFPSHQQRGGDVSFSGCQRRVSVDMAKKIKNIH